MERNRKQRWKIACIHHGTGIGGASLELLYLLQKIDRNIFEPKLLCLHDSEAKDLFQENQIAVRILDGWRDFAHSQVYWITWDRPDVLLWSSISWLITAFWYGKKILREEQPDLVYLNSTPLSAWAIAAKTLNIPVVCHIREPISEGYFGIRKYLLRSILRKNVDKFIAVSNQNARVFDVQQQTKVIYGFVHIDQFHPDIVPAETPQTTEHKKIVLYLGGDQRIKGFEVMVDALEYLDSEIVVLFGGYYHRGRTWKDPIRRVFKPHKTRAYQKLYSATNAINIGGLRDVPRWIAACDVLVSPFTVPHFARPVIEAGAMGKPVVASDVDGMDELVVDGQTGILVPAGDARALAYAINKLCADKCLAATMGRAGYRRAKALFEGQKNTQATFEVFHELLQNAKVE